MLLSVRIEVRHRIPHGKYSGYLEKKEGRGGFNEPREGIYRVEREREEIGVRMGG